MLKRVDEVTIPATAAGGRRDVRGTTCRTGMGIFEAAAGQAAFTADGDAAIATAQQVVGGEAGNDVAAGPRPVVEACACRT